MLRPFKRFLADEFENGYLSMQPRGDWANCGLVILQPICSARKLMPRNYTFQWRWHTCLHMSQPWLLSTMKPEGSILSFPANPSPWLHWWAIHNIMKHKKTWKHALPKSSAFERKIAKAWNRKLLNILRRLHHPVHSCIWQFDVLRACVCVCVQGFV